MTTIAPPEVTADPKLHENALAVPPVSPSYARYALFLLTTLYTINFLDRQIVTILAESIKNDLEITDTQLGMLTGFAFGMVYCTLGLPLARLADRFNRVWIIGGSLTVWSAFTLACGRASTYPMLVLARIGVGAGEAGFTPTSHALISDYTPKEKRASALAIFSMGTPIGSLLGLAMGGVVADLYGWRTAFLVAGFPGLLLAGVVFLTLKEPRNAMTAAAQSAAGSARMSFGATLKYLTRKRTFWFMSFGAAIKAFVSYGHAPFTTAFLLRVHEAEIASLAASVGLKPIGFIGITMGLLSGILGTISSYAGGILADRASARDLRAYGSVPAIASLVTLPFFTLAMLADSVVVAILFLLPGFLLYSLWYGPVYASAQGLVPPQMRATSASILLFIINFIGLGFGTLAVGTRNSERLDARFMTPFDAH